MQNATRRTDLVLRNSLGDMDESQAVDSGEATSPRFTPVMIDEDVHRRVARRISALPSDNPTTLTASEAVQASINYTEFLDLVEEKHEALRDVRDNLLGSRFRLRERRNELSKIREKAAIRAGSAHSCVLQHLHAIGVDLPPDIQRALGEADALRNTLGTQEVEYEEAEKEYDRQEWDYTTKEARFIVDLTESAPAPSQPQRSSSLVHHQVSPNQTLGAKDTGDSVAGSGSIFAPIMDLGNASLEIEDDLSESHKTVTGNTKRLSDLSRRFSTCTDPLGHDAVDQIVLGELDIGHTGQRWVKTQRYIDEWLLTNLTSSIHEKARLKSLSSTKQLAYEDWWRLVRQEWFRGTPHQGGFHTGDTTISAETSRSESARSPTRPSVLPSGFPQMRSARRLGAVDAPKVAQARSPSDGPPSPRKSSLAVSQALNRNTALPVHQSHTKDPDH